MRKVLTWCLLFLFLFSMSSLFFTGCDIGTTENESGSRVYLLNESDFELFCNEYKLSKNNFSKMSLAVSSTRRLSIGDTYYAVTYTVAENADDLLSDGKLSLMSQTAADCDAFEILETGVSDSSQVQIEREENSDASIRHYAITTQIESPKAVFYTYVKFQMKVETYLTFNYLMSASQLVSDPTMYADTMWEARVLYPKQVELYKFDLSYLDGDDYVDGRYNESDLVDEIQMKLGKEYYMVISLRMKSSIAENERDTVSLNINLSPYANIDGTLEVAGGVSLTERVTDNEKNINITFKLPYMEENEKDFRFIIKLKPTAVGTAQVNLSLQKNEISMITDQLVGEYDDHSELVITAGQ